LGRCLRTPSNYRTSLQPPHTLRSNSTEVRGMTMNEAFVGFDSAWGGSKNGAVAWASFRGTRLHDLGEPKPANFKDAACIIETLRAEHSYVLIALDQPTLVPNETKSRPVERVAASLICSLKSAIQYTNRGKENLFGAHAPIWEFLDRLGARENPLAARKTVHGFYLIEVYPALALPALEHAIMERKRAARYNPNNREKFSLDDWKLATGAVKRHADTLDVAQLSHWASRQAELPCPKKYHQDCLDAAICLIIALQWRRTARNRLAVIGDGSTGYMVTAVSPATRKLLEGAAKRANVPFDAPWPSDAERE